MNKLFVLGDSISIDYGEYLRSMMDGIMAYERKGAMNTAAATGDRKGAAAVDDRDFPAAFGGANGGDSGMALQYLSYLVSRGWFDFDVLLLNCGLHDVKRGPATGEPQVAPETYEANLRSIASLMRPLTRIVWVRTTPVDDRLHGERMTKFCRFDRDVRVCNEIADRVMTEAGADIADLYEFTGRLGEGDRLFADHVHYHPQIRMQQAAFIAGRLYGLQLPARAEDGT